jgi:hypothetical protein
MPILQPEPFTGTSARAIVAARLLVAAAAVSTLIAIVWFSRANRADGDPVLMMYLGWLVDRGLVPYRDFFDVHPPGAFFAYLAVGRLSQYSDLAAQQLWVVWVLLNAAGLWLLLRRFGAAVATIGAAGAAIAILPFTFQRASFVLPVLTGSAWLLTTTRPGWALKALAGAGFGVGVTIRPQIVLGLVPLTLLLWRDGRSPRERWITLAALGMGFAVPLAIAAAYLQLSGASGPFATIAREYWPLYANLPLKTSWTERAWLGARQWYPLILSLWIVYELSETTHREPSSHSRLRLALTGLTVAYLLYIPLNGNFFDQHWLPFLWCAMPALAIGAAQHSHGVWRWTEVAGVALVGLALVQTVEVQHGFNLRKTVQTPGQLAQQDRLTDYLETRPAGDRVQALDWVSGTAQALLNARRAPATEFIYSLPLHHDTNSAYTRELRDRFITEFDQRPPDVVIEFKNLRALYFPAESPFARLRQRLRDDYHGVFETEMFVVHERSDAATVE